MDEQHTPQETAPALGRRRFLTALTASVALTLAGAPAWAQRSNLTFQRWVASFRAKAIARGVSPATYDRVMNSVKPDTSVYALDRSQPEFNEEIWQYLNRRVSDWRVQTGQDAAKANAALLAKIERDYGVDRYIMLGLWGMESAFGEVIDNRKLMRCLHFAQAAGSLP